METERRELLQGLAAAKVVAAGAGPSRAQDPVEGGDAVEFLLIQNAEGVVLREGTMTLKGAGSDTLYFSDRPDRIVGRTTTKSYVDHWSVGNNNFAAVPPNAVLSISSKPEPQDIVVVLSKPQLKDAVGVEDRFAVGCA